MPSFIVSMRDAVPAPVAVAAFLCWGIWFFAEVLSEALERKGMKDSWWGPPLVRVAPVLIGVVLCATPGVLDFLREDVLGFSHLEVTPGRVVSYGGTSGAFAIVAHAWGLRAAAERILRKKVGAAVATAESLADKEKP